MKILKKYIYFKLVNINIFLKDTVRNGNVPRIFIYIYTCINMLYFQLGFEHGSLKTVKKTEK